MTTSVLLALTGDDSELLRAIVVPGSGLQVERRCGDVAELLAAAAAGLGQVAVIDTELDGVDLTVLDRLGRASVQCLLLAPSGDAVRWMALGVPVESRATAPQRIVEVLQALKVPEGGGLASEPSEEIWPFLETAPAPVEPSASQMPMTPPLMPTVPAGMPASPLSPTALPLVPMQADPTAATPPEAGAARPGQDAAFPWETGTAEGIGGDARAASWAEVAGALSGAAGQLPGASGAPLVRGASGPSGTALPGMRPARVPGQIVAVWGATGSPGRSTIAASLALGLRGAGEVLLVDADLEAPSLVQMLGMPEDSSALATSARLATHGGLDQQALAGLLTEVTPGVSLLSGLGRPGRWRELPPVSMDVVWSRCRESAAWTVVDLPGGLAEDEVNEFTLEPGRDAVVAELLARADVVLVVGGADPIGVRRLLQLLADVRAKGWCGRLEVVANRVRATAAGSSPRWAVREALERFGGLEKVTLLPNDADLADRALLEGRAVIELAPRSELGRALAELAALVDPMVAQDLKEKRRRRGGRSGVFGRRDRAERKATERHSKRSKRGKRGADAASGEPGPVAVAAVGAGYPAVGCGTMPGPLPQGLAPQGPQTDGGVPGGDTPCPRGGRHQL